MLRAFVAGVAALLLTLVVVSSAAAQGTGDIVGRVTDGSGGVLPGVTVTATNLATSISRTAVTTDTGDYAFTLLAIGNYDVKTELTGFKSQTSKVTLNSGDRARVDVKLELGAVSESVTVSGDSPLLQTDTSRVSSRLAAEVIQNAPIVGRNIINIVQLTPGASEGAANATISGNRPDDRRQSSAVSINGNPENDNLQLVDGLDNTERVMGGMGIKPSIDAIQEVVVQTNLYSAENGRTLGGVINIITKAGGNQFHGSGFYFFHNQHTDSKDYFAVTKPLNHLNQFGGSVGGPIKSNKTFFFVDYDQGRIRKDQPFIVTVPTQKMHSGDFSELTTPIYDPLTGPGARTPFPGNLIPANRWDAQAVALMNLYPMPNLPGLAGNYAYNGGSWQTNQTTDFRVDHHLTDKDTIFARYSYNLTNGLTPSQCPPGTTTYNGKTITADPTCNINGTAGIYSGPYHTFAHNIVGNWQRVVSPTMISEIKYSFVRPLTSASRPTATSATAASDFGFQNINYASDPITAGLPWLEMRPTSYAAIGDPTFIPMETEDHNHQVAGSLTKIMGAHSIKVGAGMVYRMFAVQQSQYPRSLFAFDSSITNNGSGGGGNTFASFLLGLPSVEQRVHFPIHPRNRSKEPSAYVQDDWRATSWLTLNLGMRYEVYTPITEVDNQMAAFRPEVGKIVLASDSDPTVGVKTDWTDVGPRLGFSATAPHKIVVRGGFGMTYTPVLRGAGSFLKNPPVTQNFGPFNSAATSGGNLPTLHIYDVVPALVFNDPTHPEGQVGQQVIDYKATRSKQTNFFVEKQIGGNVVTVGYINSRSDRINANQNINQPTPAAGAVQARRPYFSQYPLLTNINMITNKAAKKYDAGQVVFTRRYNEGMSFSTHYTYAHATQSTFAPWDSTLPLEWGNIPTYDITHHWVGILGYELPWGKDLKGAAHGFLAGWQLNFVANAASGPAYTIVNSSSQTNTGGSDRPNLIGDPNDMPSGRTTAEQVKQWFNTAAFALQAPLTAGNVGVGTMHGPNMKRLDLSVSKSLAQKGSRSIQVKIEIYNIFNWVNFLPPDPNFGSTTFGSLSSTGNAIPRQMQFVVKYLF